jgi:hypothetical protein
MKIKNLRVFAAAVLFGVAATLSSCILDENLVDAPQPQSEELTIEIAVPGNSLPTTRALDADDEYAVNEIDVLAFNATDKKFYGRYAGSVSGTPTHTSGSTAGATMRFKVSLPLGEFDLMVVANAGTILAAAKTAGNLDKGDAQADVLEALTLSMADITNIIGYSRFDIPMWGQKTGVKIPEHFTGANTTLNSAISLTRMVARVDVSLGAALVSANKFKMEQVRVYRPSDKGSLVPNLAANWQTIPSIPTGTIQSGNIGGQGAVSGGTSLVRSIYLFEAPAGVDPITDASFGQNNTVVVVQGKYDAEGNGFTDNASSYYRIDFAEKSSSGNWVYKPVLRNHAYYFTITDITGDGAPSWGAAQVGAPININTKLMDWADEKIHVATTNGIYMLGTSTDEVTLPIGQQGGLSTENKLTIVTDCSTGWTTKVWDTEAGTGNTTSKWLSLSTTSVSTADKTAGGTEVSLLAGANSGAEREAWIFVSAGGLGSTHIGGLTLKVHVVQKAMSIKIVDAGGNPVTALSFAANDGTATGDPAPQTFKVVWEPAELSPTVTNTQTSGTDAKFTWQNASNGLTPLPAGGEYTFTIDPAAISSTLLTSDPFYDLGSTLGFTLTNGTSIATASLTLYQGDEFSTINPGLSANDMNYAYTGGTQNFQIASYATGTKTAGGTVTGAVSWKAEFSTDGGTTYGATPPTWISGFPTSGVGTPNSTVINIPVTAQSQAGTAYTVGENTELQAAAERGSAANRWNLAGNAANGDLSGAATWQTANCYVVNAAGYYKLPLYYGNAYGNTAVAAAGATHSSAITTDGVIAGATNAVIVWQDKANLITNVGYTAGFLTFDVPKANIAQGNAVVAIRNSSNKILWSWHIWVTPTSIFDVANPATDAITTRAVDVTTQYTNYFMQYNLGYVITSKKQFASRSIKVRITQTGFEGEMEPQTKVITITQDAGMELDGINPHYQWGRKDPFPPKYASGYNFALSYVPATSIDETIANPNMVYGALVNIPYTSERWLIDPYNDLWDLGNAAVGNLTLGDNAVMKTIYDPNPVGFKMPPSNAFRGFTYSGSNVTITPPYNNIANLYGLYGNGWWFYSYPNDANAAVMEGTPIYFPASGTRHYAESWILDGPTTGYMFGYYWTGHPSANERGYSFFFNNNVNRIDPASTSGGANGARATGMSVRPIKDE